MSKTGSASIASGLLSALGTKIIASQLGPGSVALLQTLQQLRDGAVITSTANGRMALIQGASAFDGQKRREYVRTVGVFFAMGTLLIAIVMMVAPVSLLHRSRLLPDNEPLLIGVAITLAFLTLFSFLTAILNALREIGQLALLQLVSPIAAAVIAWPVATAVRTGHRLAIASFLVIPSATAAIAAIFVIARHRIELREWIQGTGRYWSSESARHFFSISGAMLVSGLAATGVLLAVRGSITSQESLAMTGQFDAAWNISMNHVMLILGSVQAYYLPSLAAAENAVDRGRQIRSMMMVAVLATAPVIVALAVLKPVVISALYSPVFVASPRFLRWTLVGDYLKVSSWVLMTPMLAARELRAFLTLDLLTQAAFWGAAKVFARLANPAESAAIGFLLSYAVCFLVCYAYAHLRDGFRFGFQGLAAWSSGFLLIVGASAHSWNERSVNVAAAAAWVSVAISVSAGFAFYMRRHER